VAAALDRPGVWLRAGMDGAVTGLDMAQALASVPQDIDLDVTRQLFMAAEIAFVVAHFKNKG
jgi:hypothetical protein